MKSQQLLENLDIEELDAFEITIYNNYSKSMSKVEALQIIINNVEGDHSQLSESLAEIAEIQEQETI